MGSERDSPAYIDEAEAHLQIPGQLSRRDPAAHRPPAHPHPLIDLLHSKMDPVSRPSSHGVYATARSQKIRDAVAEFSHSPPGRAGPRAHSSRCIAEC